MRDKAQDAVQMEKKRKDFLEAGYRLFSEKGIEAVTLPMVAEACGYGTATLYRYFDKKPGFVVAVAARKWKEVLEDRRVRVEQADYESMTALEALNGFMDRFLDTYRNQKELYRFNQFFNIYAWSENLSEEEMHPYQEVIEVLLEAFRRIYRLAESDHTLRTDISMEQMFSTILHLMMAAVSRFAVGLVYYPSEEFDPMTELTIQKDMLIEWFRAK